MMISDMTTLKYLMDLDHLILRLDDIASKVNSLPSHQRLISCLSNSDLIILELKVDFTSDTEQVDFIVIKGNKSNVTIEDLKCNGTKNAIYLYSRL